MSTDFSLFRNVIVLAPHTDDAELGCGGTMARLLESGATVSVAVFSTAEGSLPEGTPKDRLKVEFHEAMDCLAIPAHQRFVYNFPVRHLSSHRQEVLEELVSLKRKLAPDAVFLPASSDLHQDHQVLHAEGLRAFKDTTVFGYELPWNHINFSAQAFVALGSAHLEKKWECLQAYKTQTDLQRPYFTRDFQFGLARVRGVQVKAEFAECFEVQRVRL